MSGECNVCGQVGCVEARHCPFVAERDQAIAELLECLRELADFSINDPHYRSRNRSQQARIDAYAMLKRFNA